MDQPNQVISATFREQLLIYAKSLQSLYQTIDSEFHEVEQRLSNDQSKSL